MRIHIIGAFTPANLGDGAIVLQMAEEARRVFGTDTIITVSATDPFAFQSMLGIDARERLIIWNPLGSWSARLLWLLSRASELVGVCGAVRLNRTHLQRSLDSKRLTDSSRRFLLDVIEADLVLAAGGGYLSDPYRKQFPFWHLEYRSARAADVPLVFFSQSFGPVERPTSRRFLRGPLRDAALFITRDGRSEQNLRTFSPKTRVLTCPDVALTTRRAIPMNHGARTVGVSLLRWVNFSRNNDSQHEEYLEAVRRGVRSLLSADPALRVRLYATNVSRGRNAMDDMSVCEDLYQRLCADGYGGRCSTADWTPSPMAFAADVAGCEMLIASRMHSAVLALTQGVPVVGIAYEEKMSGLLELIGLTDWSASIEEPQQVEELIIHGWPERPHLARIVLTRLPEVQTAARKAMEECGQLMSARRSRVMQDATD